MHAAYLFHACLSPLKVLGALFQLEQVLSKKLEEVEGEQPILPLRMPRVP